MDQAFSNNIGFGDPMSQFNELGFKINSPHEEKQEAFSLREIYAEFGTDQVRLLSQGELYISLPHGSEVVYKHGRGIKIACNTEDSYTELIEALDDGGISWQEA